MAPDSPKNTTFSNHAIVIGGSIAGLMAGRVLADSFDRVTIIERDNAPEAPEPRKGVPQGRHVHLLLRSGASIISECLPRFFDDLEKEGATPVDSAEDLCWFHHGVWKGRFKTGIISYFQSRPFLEWHIRRRLTAETNVRFLQACEVTQLLSDTKRTRITGVRIASRNGNQLKEDLYADLVVDASGRGSRTPRWLELLGYEKPQETAVSIDLAYATRLYQQKTDLKRDWRALVIFGKPPFSTRGGVLAPVEGKHWLVTLAGYFGDHPPTDDKGFLEFARHLDAPDIYETIKDAEPLTAITKYKFASSLRRYYERMSRFPDGLVAIGDAMCSFNPIYGQGMSVSALEAKALAECLQKQQILGKGKRVDLSRPYFKKVTKIIDTAWRLATSEDFRYPQTKGKRPLGTRFLNWYTAQLFQLSSHHATVYTRFLEVMHLQKPPAVLFSPDIALQVVKRRLSFRGAYQPSIERPRITSVPNENF